MNSLKRRQFAKLAIHFFFLIIFSSPVLLGPRNYVDHGVIPLLSDEAKAKKPRVTQ